MESRLENRIAKWIKWSFCIVFTLVFVVVIFVDKRITASPNSTLETIAPNLLLLLLPAGVIAGLLILWGKCPFAGKVSGFLNRRFLLLLWGMSALLLTAQIFIAYHIYFFAGWDPDRKSVV